MHIARYAAHPDPQAPGRYVEVRLPHVVTAPLELSLPVSDDGGEHLSPFVLSALVYHAGATAKSGHYFAYVRRGAQWWLCNDHTIAELYPQQFESTAVQLHGLLYLAFYEHAQQAQ